MQHLQHTFPCGLRVVHIPVSSPVAYCGFAVNVGSRDELNNELGMAHFVEHMIFKGTAKRSSYNILNRMEKVGGELNACTSKEDTFVYSMFLKEDFSRAAELLCDLVCNSVFPEQELVKERDVVLDEINSYRDNPPELIYDEFEEALFSSNPIGHNILGEEQILETFDSPAVSAFFKKWYTPSNMIFFSLGDIPFKKIIALLEKNFTLTDNRQIIHNRVKPLKHDIVNIRSDKDTHQGHVMIGAPAFEFDNPLRSPLALLNNILGGPGMNSRLNISLREKRGYVYNVESNYTAYSDTGVFSIYFGTDKDDIDKCITLCHKEMARFRDVAMTSSQLESAKRQMRGQIGIASDNKESLIMGSAKLFLHQNRFETVEDAYNRLDKITASQILEVANTIFNPDDLSTIIYV